MLMLSKIIMILESKQTIGQDSSSGVENFSIHDSTTSRWQQVTIDPDTTHGHATRGIEIWWASIQIQCTMVRKGDKTYSVILSYYNIFGLLGNF